MHIKRVFWRFKEWIRKGRMAPDLARKMLTWGLRKEWSGNFIEQSIYKRIWRRTALLNGTRIADTYALDPLDPLGCRHLCILYHWPSWHFVISKIFFLFFLNSLTRYSSERTDASNSSLISKIIAYNLNKNTNKNAIKLQNTIFLIN